MSKRKETRHAVAHPQCCRQMADKYGWDLDVVIHTGVKDLPFTCVFKGECKFPKCPMDYSQGDNNND